MSFKDFVKAAEVAGVERSDPFEVSLNGVSATLVVERADGGDWAAAAVHPPRLDLMVDLHYGFNASKAVEGVIPQTVIFVDEDGESKADAAEWANILRALDGAEASKITNTVWVMNIIDPAKRAAELKKASTGSSRKKRS